VRAQVEKAGMTPGKVVVEKRPDGSLHLDVEATFADIHKVRGMSDMNMPTSSLAKDEKGNVVYTMPTGLASPGTSNAVEIPGMGGKQHFTTVKFVARGMKMSVKVNLPGPVLETNGTKTGERTVEWDYDLDKMTYEDASKDMRAVIPGDSVEFKLPVGAAPAAPAVEEGAQPAPAPAPIPEAQAPGEFKVDLASVKTEMTFTPSSGRHEGEVKLTLAVQPPPGMELVECQGSDFGTIATNDGQRLALTQDPWVHPDYSRGGDGSYTIELSLGALRQGAASLPSVKGNLIMVASAGTTNARFSPLKDWIGKPLQSADLEGLQVRLSSVTPDAVELWMDNRAHTAIKDVVFQNADGTRAYENGTSTSGHPGGWTCRYDVQVTPGGAMTLEIYKEPQKVTIPIDLKNVTVP
jgi:hypothetical protein